MHPGYDTKIYCVVAAGMNGEIGKCDKLLWKQRSDMKRFKLLTMASGCVIMGRKTFESIGKPLERRLSIVLTSGDTIEETEFVKPVKSIHEAMMACESRSAVFVIGGQSVYDAFMPYYDQMFLTMIDGEFPEADAHFKITAGERFIVKKSESFTKDQDNEYNYSFINLERVT